LDGMEKAIRSRIRIRRDQVNFIRYADDCAPRARAGVMNSARAQLHN